MSESTFLSSHSMRSGGRLALALQGLTAVLAAALLPMMVLTEQGASDSAESAPVAVVAASAAPAPVVALEVKGERAVAPTRVQLPTVVIVGKRVRTAAATVASWPVRAADDSHSSPDDTANQPTNFEPPTRSVASEPHATLTI